jgi:hypothetical protein
MLNSSSVWRPGSDLIIDPLQDKSLTREEVAFLKGMYEIVKSKKYQESIKLGSLLF